MGVTRETCVGERICKIHHFGILVDAQKQMEDGFL